MCRELTIILPAEREIIEQNRERQQTEGAKRDRLRESKTKAKTKEKKESKTSSPSMAAFAKESKHLRRRALSPSPSGNTPHDVSEKTAASWKKTRPPLCDDYSSVSSSAGGAGVDD